jgi:putative ABC transport system permease protein
LSSSAKASGARDLTFGFPANGVVSREVVGIVGDVRDASLAKQPGPMLYVPFAQAPLYGGEVVVKSALNPSAVAGAIRSATRAIDKNLPVTDVATMPEAMSTSVAQPRLRTVLLALFGGMALILAAVGLFGVISYSVARRTRELGIRLALGAEPRLVLGMIVRETLGLTLAGIVIGVPCAIGLAHVIRYLLFDVTPYDGITMVSVCALLVTVGTLASVVPARRAMHIAPVVALRCE